MNGQEFRAWRKKMGMTQAQAGEALGVSPRSVISWEQDAAPITRAVELAVKSLSNSEAEDFLNELRDRGRAGEFELVYRDDPIIGRGPQYIQAQTIVRDRVTQKEQRYAAGHATSWVNAFFEDLDAGLWDRPDPPAAS